MQIITGFIADVSKLDPKNMGYKKKELIINSMDDQEAKIEFRNDMVDMLDGFSEGDKVIIAFVLKCNTSKKTGITYNNLIAKSIKKTTP